MLKMYFSDINAAEYTPATAYDGDPINNRLFAIIFSSVAIPVTWVGSYFGLFLYFRSFETGIVFILSDKVRNKINITWSKTLFSFIYIIYPIITMQIVCTLCTVDPTSVKTIISDS